MRVITRTFLGIAAAVVALTAASCGKTYDSQGDAAHATLEAGTEVAVEPLATLSPVTEKAGDEFTATLASPLIADGQIVAPQGSTVVGEVVDAKTAGSEGEESFLSLELKEIVMSGGETVEIETEPLRYTPAQEHTASAETPPVVPQDTTVRFRLAEAVEVPLPIAPPEKPIS